MGPRGVFIRKSIRCSYMGLSVHRPGAEEKEEEQEAGGTAVHSDSNPTLLYMCARTSHVRKNQLCARSEFSGLIPALSESCGEGYFCVISYR